MQHSIFSQFSGFSRFFGPAVMILVLASVLNTASAATANLYVIRGISVDETASTAATARAKAIQAGQRRAFDTLLRRLVLAPYHQELPKLDSDTITPLVASFEVANERSSAQRYLADFTFEFKREDVRRILRAQSLPFSESVAKPLLVLPVFSADGRQNLWDEPNPWLSAWTDIIGYGVRPQAPPALRDDWAQNLLQPVIVPSGDLADIKAITAEQAVSLDKAALDAIRDIYGTSGVLVITARLRIADDGTSRLEVTRQRSGQLSQPVVETYRGDSDGEQLMHSAIFDLLGNIQENWKRQNVLDFSSESTLAVTTKVTSLPDWLTIEERVKTLAAVSATKVKELSVGQAFWYITFLGTIDQLTSSLAQNDLVLAEQDGYWTLDPAR